MHHRSAPVAIRDNHDFTAVRQSIPGLKVESVQEAPLIHRMNRRRDFAPVAALVAVQQRLERGAVLGDRRRRGRRDDQFADLKFDGPQVHRDARSVRQGGLACPRGPSESDQDGRITGAALSCIPRYPKRTAIVAGRTSFCKSMARREFSQNPACGNTSIQ